MVGLLVRPGLAGLREEGHFCYQHYHPTTVDNEEPVAKPEECGGWDARTRGLGRKR